MNRKRLTREMVEMKAGGASYADIALKIGVTRQRIQQYFSPPLREMEAIADRAKALCENCGHFDQFGHYHHKVYDFDILNTVENILYLCNTCHLKLNGTTHYCNNCGKTVPHGRRYCSAICRKAYYSVDVECSNCCKIFTMNANQKIRIRKSTSGLLFCSKRCQGLFLGKHHIPFAGVRVSKYDAVVPSIAQRISESEKLNTIILSMNIPRGSHSLLRKLVNKSPGG